MMTESEKEAFNLILKKLPEFREYWCKYADEQAELDKEIDEEFDPSLYELASVFSRFAIEQFKCGNQEFLKNSFNLIEELGGHSDESVSECAMVGFIEGVLMRRSHEGIELSVFDPYLGTRSREFWYCMHDFFTGNA